MSAQINSRHRAGWLAVTVLATCGCAKAPVAGDAALAIANPTTGPAVSAPSDSPPSPSTTHTETGAPEQKLHQSFEQACTTEFAPDSGQQLPPDRTLTGKPTGPLSDAVYRSWEQIRFVTPAGKPLTYVATLQTEFGPVELVLLHEVAPNHVRNFVALVRTGYYDGLVFERIIRATPEGGAALELAQAGCPLGTGESGLGHIGYFVKPEFSATIKHEPGLVGAMHDLDPNTAGCRFYIALTPAPVLDGHFTVFAKVTQGLEVVRQIAGQPVQTAPGQEGRPVRPAVIKSVTIRAHESGNK